jgi:hypothetical protein
MPKFDKGAWVRHVSKGDHGHVVGHRDRSVLVRWVGRHKAEAVGARSLADMKPPRALVLEGALDGNLGSPRSEEDLLRNWFHANDIPFAYKTVLTLDGIEAIGRVIGTKRPLLVHLSCHGDYDDGRPYILLAPRQAKSDRIYLDDETVQRVFREAFGGLPLLFSACLLGRHEGPMRDFRKGAGLSGIAAFTRDVWDSETMLFELLLYKGMFDNRWTLANAAEKACEALRLIDVKGERGSQALVRVF